MNALTRCDDCGSIIYASNVFKTVVIPGAVGHLALVFRCSACDLVGKAAASVGDWEQAQVNASEHDEDMRKAMAAAHIDVESIETVSDLLAEWSVGPVLREDIMHLCKCKECKKRLKN